ncbi:MAG: acyl carrier protein [Gammaproteobacteria bacterium]|nr:acyl carrier protein [Gammaproteobacteria bacterium]
MEFEMKNTSNTVHSRVLRLVAEVLALSAEKVTQEALLNADLGATSMDLVSIAIAIDDEFDVEIDLAALPKGDVTVAQVVDHVADLVGA